MDERDVSEQLQERAAQLLRAGGHSDCTWLRTARYEPEAEAAVCGCGQFVDWPADGGQTATTEGTAVVARGGAIAYEARDPIESTLALIDPSEVYSPQDVERHILDVLMRLETGALFERETVTRYAAAKYAFDRAYWRAVNESAQTSADRRKAEAMTACETEAQELAEAEMVRDAAKTTMHNLRAVLSGYQSTARSVGTVYQAGGSQGGVPR